MIISELIFVKNIRTYLEEAEWSQFGGVCDDVPHALQSTNNKPAFNSRRQ